MKFTVATWNLGALITGNAYKRAGLSTAHIANMVGSYVGQYNVVLLQEVAERSGFLWREHQIDLIRARSGHPHVKRFPTVRWSNGLVAVHNGVAVLSRFPIEHTELLAPHSLQYSRINIGGRRVHFFGAHYPHAFYDKAIVGNLVRHRMKPIMNEPVVFGADFNGDENAVEVTMFTGPGTLRMAATRYGSIDHILVRNTGVRWSRVEDPPPNQAKKFLSDHPLVSAELEI